MRTHTDRYMIEHIHITVTTMKKENHIVLLMQSVKLVGNLLAAITGCS